MKLIVVILLFFLNKYCISMHPRPMHGSKHRHRPGQRHGLRHVERPVPKYIQRQFMLMNFPQHGQRISKREYIRRHLHRFHPGYPQDYMAVYYYPDGLDEGIGVDPRLYYERNYHSDHGVHRKHRGSGCESGEEFDCGDGSCVNLTLVCDGNNNCANGKDEHNDFCLTKSNEKMSCRYPVRIAHMTFTMNYTLDKDNIKKEQPPEVPEFVQAVFTCDPGYIGDGGNSVVSNCIAERWQPPMPICLKPCPDLVTIDMQQDCFDHYEQIDCNNILPEGTHVRLTCQKAHHYPNHDAIKCQQNGKWSINPVDLKCNPTCGMYDQEIAELMRGKDFPWRILIKETVNNCEYFFSGTLIDRKLILSDRSGFNRSENPNDFLIYVNDDVASWAPLEMSYKVKNIHFINDYYHELESPNGLSSLVIFETEIDVEFGVTVCQVCMSPYSYPAVQEIINVTGQIVTVGDVNEYQNLDRDETFILEVSSIDNEACSKLVDHTKWYTDQFCGLMQGSKTLTDADRGTGLVQYDNKRKIYFLEGVYSGVHPNSNVLTFTIVSNYVEWIDTILAKVEHSRPIQKKASSQDKPHSNLSSQDKPHSNLLIVFLLLSFVILIAVFLRVR